MHSHRGLARGRRASDLIVAAAFGQPGTTGTILPNALQAGDGLVLALEQSFRSQPK